jgi:tRNA threonylcarbamoyladenosine biosynthesis protein TsaE
MHPMEKLHIIDVEDLTLVAEKILTYARAYKKEGSAFVVALSGTLGAGKTALTQELAKLLGVAEQVVSPTFVVMKRYQIDSALALPFEYLVHIDAYRIEEDDEMRPLRFNEVLEEDTTLVCIEWAEKIKNVLPESLLTVTITLESDDSRTFTFTYA